jgi:hypothetical protein
MSVGAPPAAFPQRRAAPAACPCGMPISGDGACWVARHLFRDCLVARYVATGGGGASAGPGGWGAGRRLPVPPPLAISLATGPPPRCVGRGGAGSLGCALVAWNGTWPPAHVPIPRAGHAHSLVSIAAEVVADFEALISPRSRPSGLPPRASTVPIARAAAVPADGSGEGGMASREERGVALALECALMRSLQTRSDRDPWPQGREPRLPRQPPEPRVPSGITTMATATTCDRSC